MSSFIKHCRSLFSKENPNKQSTQIIENTGWQIFEKAIRLFSALISGVLIARHLQPELYGTYNYALVFISFFVSISNLGSNQLFVRELVKEPERSQEIVSSAFAIRILSGSFLTVLAIGLSFLIVSEMTTRLLVIVFSLQIILRSSESIEFFFQSRLEHQYIAFSRSIASVLYCLLTIGLIITDKSIIALSIASIGEYAISLVAIFIVYTKQGQSLNYSFISLDIIKRTLSDSWPLIISSIAITAYMRVDQIMINNMIGSIHLGRYSAAVHMTEAFYIIPIAFINSNFPKIIQLRETNENKFYESLQNLYNKVSIMSYASIIFVSIFSREILISFYGKSYSEAVPVFTLLIWSVLFVTLGAAQSTFVISMNWTKIHLKTILIGSVANVFLNFLLLPLYGEIGAAIATIASYWIAMHGACFLFQPLRRTRNMVTRSIALVDWTF